MILQWLASPEWAQVVQALLHTLWQAVAVAVFLGFVLRRAANPVARYRCSLGALATVLAIGLISWALLNRAVNVNQPAPIAASNNSLSKPMEVGKLGEPSTVVVVRGSRTEMTPTTPRWTAWLALVWLAGAGLMLARAGAQMAGAERLRRSCRPLEDTRVSELVAEARQAVGLARKIRIAVTDKLTSPAVVGVVVPTLILPLSLVTTLTPEQIRFVLLHELAHIRRGDYLANLFQLFAEAILFFNPAVWWISHQVRREREACCDALAIELSGAPADYARTLVRVAESVLNPPPAAAPAFGDKQREPSTLADRVQRLLVPGYRPALRLTWRAMLTAMVLGGMLLVLSAVGTRITVAQIMAAERKPEPSNETVETNNKTTLSAMIREQTSLESKLQTLHDLKPADPPELVGSFSADAELTALLRQYHQAQDDAFLKDNHSSHPSFEYLNARKLANELDKQVNARAAVVLADLEKRAKDGRAAIEQMRANASLAHPEHAAPRQINASGGTPAPAISEEVVREQHARVFEFESEQARQEAKLKNLQALKPAILRETIQSSAGPDAELTELLERYRRALDTISSLRDNPSPSARSEYENAKKLADELDRKINDRVEGILVGLDIRMQAGRAAIKELKASLDPAQNSAQVQPFDVASQTSEFNAQTGIATYSNKVVLKHGTNTISADRMTVNQASGEVSVEGHVRVHAGDKATTGENLSYNSHTGAIGFPKSNERLSNSSGDNHPVDLLTRTFLLNISNLRKQTSITEKSTPEEIGQTLHNLFVDAGATTQPDIFFFWHDDGRMLVRATKPQLAAVEKAILSLNGEKAVPSAAAEGNSPVIPPLSSAAIGQFESVASTNLYIRKYMVHAPALLSNLRQQTGLGSSSTLQEKADALVKLFSRVGVDIRPDTGKNAFFNDSRGELLVRATKQDLDAIEALLQIVATPEPQIDIKSRFYLVPQPVADSLWAKWPLTNNAGTGSWSRVLSPLQAKELLKDLESTPVTELGDSRITTLSGRQAQIQVIDLKPVVSMGTNGLAQTNLVPVGPILDVVPTVDPDGYTIQMTVIPTLKEFLGYDDPGQFVIVIERQLESNASPALPAPKLRARNASVNNILKPFPLPSFRVRQMSITTNVLDGRTLVLGGLTATDPVFRNGQVATQTNQLIVFVTPTIVTSAGNRVHSDDDLPPAPKNRPTDIPR